VPGIDRLAIDVRLPTHRFQPGAIEKGRQQRVAGERLVEPGETGCRALKAASKRRTNVLAGCVQQCVKHAAPRRKRNRRT
jgi:hypothetical protein